MRIAAAIVEKDRGRVAVKMPAKVTPCVQEDAD